METLKVALVSDWFYPKVGGVETHIHELALRLQGMGHEPHVITHIAAAQGLHDGWKPPYPVHRFKAAIYVKRLHVGAGLGMMRKVNDLYKEIGFDVTHAHGLFSPLAMLTSYVSRGIRDVPVVATNHSLLGSPRLGFAYKRLVRFMARKVDVFIAVSSVVAEDTRRMLGGSLGERRLVVIHNGVDTGFWRPPSSEERSEARRRLGVEDRLVIGVVARLTRRKRVDLIPRLAERLGGEAVFLMAGDGPERSMLEEMVRERGVEGRVIMLGFLPREKVREVLWASDVFLSPGELEACPIAVIEAQSAGIPVVGRNRSGVGDIVVHGETGFLFDSLDEAAGYLETLLANRSLRGRMAAAARRRAVERFSWESVVNRILEAYREAMDMASSIDRHMLLHRAWMRVKG